MDLRDRLARVVEGMPEDGAVTLPVAWIRAQLAGREAGFTADLTVEAVAERLGRAPSTIRTWCGEGRIRGAYKLRNREWRVPPDALAAFQEEERNGTRDLQADAGGVDLGAWRREAAP